MSKRSREQQKRRRVRHHTLHYVDGQPTAATRIRLQALGVQPAFTGEMMHCAICGRTQQSDRRRDSQWRVLDVDGERSYFCPAEFPPDTASSDSFKLAYERALAFAVARRDPQLQAQLITKGLHNPIAWE